MNRTEIHLIAAVLTVTLAAAAVQPQAQYNLKGAGGIRDGVAPPKLADQTGQSPDLARQGLPKTVANAPEGRRTEYNSSVKFTKPGQCYSVAKNLASGDNFVLEAWACASKDNDAGWHSVVANGNGGTGFLLAQNDDHWSVLVGGVGAASLGPVQPGTWTHLAIVKDQGQVTGWLNGEKVADLPDLGGGAANFSIGATSPGKEPFNGMVSEVRYASIEPGLFDPATDFLPGAKRSNITSAKKPERAKPVVKRTPAWTFQTQSARLGIDARGFIVSLTSGQSGEEYSPDNHPSPLMSLHEYGQPNEKLLFPTAAAFDKGKQEFTLKYPNGATAVVKALAKGTYFRLQLASLTPRGNVDNIVWGPLHTTISGRIGDILGVVRNGDWAIGMWGLDDNTIAGPVEDADCYEMGYYIHSLDPVNHPVPAKYKEGQKFDIGGDGVNDVAFYSHPEEYFQQVFGSGAWLQPEFGSSVAYHARDRRRSYTHFFSLLPGFKIHERKHMVSDPVEAVDFIGSAVALYACPDDEGIATLETIFKGEGQIYVTDRDGLWIRNPLAARPTIYWNGPVDKAIEYTKALGLKDISRDTGEFYSVRPSGWVGQVNYHGKNITYKEFADMCHQAGLTHGGLHTLCMFLQGGISRDVAPVPSEHLQTVCRTKLAKDISPTDTEIVVTEPSFLAEGGTWPVNGKSQSYIRVGGEMMIYQGISASVPWTLKGVKRGHASTAAAHRAGDDLVKLQQNCYNGFVPDLKLMLDYADDYVDLMVRNGMDTINFDGYETMTYQNHGYYGFKIFNRRLFEGYHARTGKWPRVTGSNVFPGAWEYMNVCDLGGGDNMFNAVSGRRAIEGKDIGNGFSSSYFPGTFGIQGWHSNWSLYDAENLEAKSIGWDATYAFSVSADGIDKTGERDAIFKHYRAWEDARGLGVFTKEMKKRLTDPAFKFHLEQTGEKTFVLYPVKEVRISQSAGSKAKQIALGNPQDTQPLQFALQVDGVVNGFVITLPDGLQIKSDQKIEKGQFIICKGSSAHVADHNRKKIADLGMTSAAVLPKGASKFGVQFPQAGDTKVRFGLTIWIFGKSEELRAPKN